MEPNILDDSVFVHILVSLESSWTWQDKGALSPCLSVLHPETNVRMEKSH